MTGLDLHSGTTLLLLGAAHGLNPGMGWLFAVALGLQERRRNVRGAFAPARASPARVCLVDDIYTSGATAGAAASALRRGGARRVEVVTFARAVR